MLGSTILGNPHIYQFPVQMAIIQALDEGGLSDTVALERLTRRWEGEGGGWVKTPRNHLSDAAKVTWNTVPTRMSQEVSKWLVNGL